MVAWVLVAWVLGRRVSRLAHREAELVDETWPPHLHHVLHLDL
jgi:hypothetical protein